MKIEDLTRQAFQPFGDVVEMPDAAHYTINQGFAERFDNLANIDVAMEGGAAKVSLFDVRPRPTPIQINLMERHPLGSQLFYPLQNENWLVLVCADPHDAKSYRCFRASGQQGINYARSTWHFPLLVFAPSKFIVIDRKGPGHNLDEVMLAQALSLGI